MFDISVLKEMKLSELQEIAKTAKTIKFNGVKKDTLISLILDHQAATTAVEPVIAKSAEEEKTKRARIPVSKKVAIQKSETSVLFDFDGEKSARTCVSGILF